MRNFFIASFLVMTLSASAFAETVKVSVNGLVCAFCGQGIKKTFSKEGAVDSVDVNLDNKLVTLKLKKDQKITDERIGALIKDAGYNLVKIERSEK